jgi:hypothetical protein
MRAIQAAGRGAGRQMRMTGILPREKSTESANTGLPPANRLP